MEDEGGCIMQEVTQAKTKTKTKTSETSKDQTTKS